MSNTNTTNQRHHLSTQDTLKKKSSRACTHCRKRKVKCNGELPCQRCTRSDTTCVYDTPQQKKETPKPIVESHAPRLNYISQCLKQYAKLIQPTMTLPTTVQNNRVKPSLSIDTTGHGLYVPDYPYRSDRPHHANPVLLQPTIQPSLSEPIRHDLLKIYFEFIDPVFPLFHTPSFQTQDRLLLYAIYAVSSRWDMAETNEPRGWTFYQRAIYLLERQTVAELATVQAVLLLLKYNEHVRRPGFVYRTRYYFSIVLRLCQDLGLSRDIDTLSLVERESRKRVFWVIYCYDVMMSIEYGTLPQLEPCLMDLPIPLADETADKLTFWTRLIQIVQHQATILHSLRHPDDRYLLLSQQLTDLIQQIPREEVSYANCFLHLASHFSMILLHRHLDLAYRSAVTIREMVEWILECHAHEDMYCSIRGVQQIVHYLSAAFTVFKEKGSEEEASVTFGLIRTLASISPVIEIKTDDY